MNRDREHAERMMETAREMTKLAARGRFRTDPILIERVHLRAIFFTESADKLSSGFKARYPSVWKAVHRFRTLVVHDYLKVDPDDLWNFVRDELPSVVSTLRRAKYSEQ